MSLSSCQFVAMSIKVGMKELILQGSGNGDGMNVSREEAGHARTHEKFYLDGGWWDKEKARNAFEKWNQMDPATIVCRSRHK